MKSGTVIKQAIALAGYIGTIILFVFSNLANAKFPITVNEALIIIGIVLAISLLCWLIVYLALKGFLDSGDKSRKEGLSELKKEEEKVVGCSAGESVLCSLNFGINEYGLEYQNDEPISEKERLYKKDYVYGIEDKGRNNEPWRDIWVFSEDLTSEIDPKKNKAEDVVLDNIINKKTRYTFFYLNSQEKESTVEDNKE